MQGNSSTGIRTIDNVLYLEENLNGPQQEAFRDFSQKEKLGYVELIFKIDSRRGDHVVYEDAAYISVKTLRSLCGKNGFEKINDKVGLVLCKDDFKPGAYTKPYYLKDGTSKILKGYEESLRNGEIENSQLVYTNGKFVPNYDPTKKNAIELYDREGIKRPDRPYLPYLIHLNDETLHRFWNKLLDQKDEYIERGEPVPKDLKQNIYQLGRLYPVCKNEHYQRGQMPRQYQLLKSGRIQGLGVNLQGMPDEIRRVALAGKDCRKYDISNCQWDLLRQLAAREGIDCPAITDYINNKKQWRREITYKVYGPEIESGILKKSEAIAKVKEALLSLIFGARIRPKLNIRDSNGDIIRPAIPNTLSLRGPSATGESEKAKIFFETEEFKALYSDLGHATTSVIEAAEKSFGQPGYLANELGRRFKVKGEKKEKKLAHILQGAEALILHTVMRHFPVIVPIHDGWIVEGEVSPELFERVIKEETGFRVHVNMEEDYRKIRI